jgi:hypothetical protein
MRGEKGDYPRPEVLKNCDGYSSGARARGNSKYEQQFDGV